MSLYIEDLQETGASGRHSNRNKLFDAPGPFSSATQTHQRTNSKIRKVTWRKIAPLGAMVLGLSAIVGLTVLKDSRNTVTVETGHVTRKDLASVVTASGVIKPKTYVSVGANAFGRITNLYVKEGDRVKKGQLLARLENVQLAADVAAQHASLEQARADARAARAALGSADADLRRATAEADHKRFDYQRALALYQQGLIAKSDYDARKAAWETAEAGLDQAQARLAQTKAQEESAQSHIRQAGATFAHASDVLSKSVYTSPFDGIVSNLPVREGETVVVGVQNSPGSTLMTIADMTVVTAEVRVDETDIVNVRVGQAADVTIDAIPDKVFKGRVTEIGDNALVRSTGLATTQMASDTEAAKDFKVVITLENPPDNLRPGLSASARITTTTRSNVLAVPIQALTIRHKSELQVAEKRSKTRSTKVNSQNEKDEEVQGVFAIRNGLALFQPVDTGITATTEIEIIKGLRDGDEIVTGSYNTLANLHNRASIRPEL